MDNNTNTSAKPTPTSDTPDASGEGEVSGYGLGMGMATSLGSDQPLPINEDTGNVTSSGSPDPAGTVEPTPWSGVGGEKEIFPPPAP